MYLYALSEIVDRLKKHCRNYGRHSDRVTISSQLVYNDNNLALGTKPGFAPEKFSVYMVNQKEPLVLTSVEVGEKCKVGDFIRKVKKMEDIVHQQMKTVNQDESSFIDPPELFFVINDIFGLFDDKKPIKYMEINNFETYSAPHSKSQILMTYVESPGPSNLRIPYQNILFRDNLLST